MSRCTSVHSGAASLSSTRAPPRDRPLSVKTYERLRQVSFHEINKIHIAQKDTK